MVHVTLLKEQAVETNKNDVPILTGWQKYPPGAAVNIQDPVTVWTFLKWSVNLSDSALFALHRQGTYQ